MTDLDKLWQLAEEMLEQREAARDEAPEEEREWYHEGWVDAMKWIIDTIEEEILGDRAEHEDSDEW